MFESGKMKKHFIGRLICEMLHLCRRFPGTKRVLMSLTSSSQTVILSLSHLFFCQKKNPMRFTRRLSVKPASTGSLQGRALDTTLECRLMGNQEAVGKSCRAAPLQYVRRCTHAPAEPRAARVGAYRFQINRGQHTQTDTP